jgi:DNA-binding NtrC family response regulator
VADADHHTRQISDEADASGGELLVRVVKGESVGQETALPRGQPVLIGTSFEATVQLKDNAVSRLHLELIYRGGLVHARDLGSTNGSFAEGLRFSAIDLLPGSMFRIGETEMQIVSVERDDPMPISQATQFGGLVGRSRKMREMFAVLERVSRTNSTVLLTGETGTGKEVAADAIHRASPRSAGPYVVVDCASIPASLIGSELFGHLKGAFTHAENDRVGAFASANGGTIFLDEIGELPVDMQPRLLRVLETRTVKPIGGNEVQKVDVRVVAATNRNLEDEVRAGRFRSDLYFRLAVVKVQLPALRERREDILPIARHLSRLLSQRSGEEDAGELEFSPENIAAMISYAWPGNVRELRNVIQQALSLSSEGLSLAAKLSTKTRGKSPVNVAREVGAEGFEIFYELPFRDARKRAVDAFELGYVRNAIEREDGNVSRAAEKMGLHRNMVHRILKREKSEESGHDRLVAAGGPALPDRYPSTDEGE